MTVLLWRPHVWTLTCWRMSARFEDAHNDTLSCIVAGHLKNVLQISGMASPLKVRIMGDSLKNELILNSIFIESVWHFEESSL